MTGLVTAIAICRMLDRNPKKSMADLYRALPETFGTPTMSPRCDDEKKYGVVDRVTAALQAMKAGEKTFAGQKIAALVTVNGARVGGRGRHLGAGAGVVQQAGTGRGGGKPGVVGAPARDVRGAGCAAAPKSRGGSLQPDVLIREREIACAGSHF
jgi:hypothetical protein